MRSLVLAALMMLTTLGPPAAALAQSSERVLEDARLTPVRVRLARAVQTARREGLPSEWLLDKIAEGLSKRVPPPRIAVAVDALLGRIRTAERLTAVVPGAQGTERRRMLRAAVDALAAGAPSEGLGALVREVAVSDAASALQNTHEALTTVAELAERDFGGDAAVAATSEAFRRGRRGGLADLLRRARQIGRDPPGGRDGALRHIGGQVGRGRSGIDPSGARGDHGADGEPRRGPR